MPLTDVAIRNAKPREKPYKLHDGDGLYLLVMPNGAKYWRFRYRSPEERDARGFGTEKMMGLGVYPETRAAEARAKRDAARKVIAQGRDPLLVKREKKYAAALAAGNTFEAIAREWFAKYSPRWAKSHADKVIRRLERDIFPWIGRRPITAITAPELLAVLRRIEARGAIETAHRAHQNCSQVFRYAIATGRAERDPSPDLRGAIPPARSRPYPSVRDPQAVGSLMRAINSYHGSFVTRCALRLAPLVFVRPGELRAAQWSEIDLDAAEWRIPAERMKSRRPHIVPLSDQAVAILRELYPVTSGAPYVFPSVRSSRRPMSENTINAALRSLGYSKEQLTGHGFRSMASTILNEQGWNRDVIERQLAHAERNAVRAAYNHAEYLPERRRMMQAWADYLDALAAGASVTPIRRVA